MDAHQVDRMVRANRPFEAIEEAIDAAQIDADVKAALWLYALARTDMQSRRRVTRELLGEVRASERRAGEPALA